MKPRLQQMIRWLGQGLVEREQPIRLMLLAALAGEHLLLIGPPGTAKSELARRLYRLFSGGAYFERLLTRFSVPEELFGPLSIKALERDEYLRLTEGYLPTASIAFIDEVFKANSAILNALLTLLNEREFDNGTQRLGTPLVTVMAASNELPQDDELAALYDRFLLRFQVQTVSDAGFEALLALPDNGLADPVPPATIDSGTLARILASAADLPLDEDVVALLQALRRFLGEQGHAVSDRRWRKALKLLRVAAVTDGRERVSVWDCWLLQHCLWEQPQQRAQLADWYQGHLGTAAVLDPQRLSRLIETWQDTLAQESQAVTPLRNAAGEALYIDADGSDTLLPGHMQPATRDGEPLYLAPVGGASIEAGSQAEQADLNGQSNPAGSSEPAEDDSQTSGYTRAELREQFFDDHYSQCHIDGHWVSLEEYLRRDGSRLQRYQAHPPRTEPVRYSAAHISDRTAEMDALSASLEAYKQRIRGRVTELDRLLIGHLWVDPGFAVPARRNLQHTLDVVVTLAEALATLKDGFAALPRQG